LQTDGSLDTGFVKVTMGAGGIPSYDIVRPSAWDAIRTTEALVAAAKAAPAVIFGSLAQRDATSAATIQVRGTAHRVTPPPSRCEAGRIGLRRHHPGARHGA
jgi:hypothetical protein